MIRVRWRPPFQLASGPARPHAKKVGWIAGWTQKRSLERRTSESEKAREAENRGKDKWVYRRIGPGCMGLCGPL